jgi:REP element-mobilizing transposase RayT
MSRGNGKMRIFLDDVDYRHFIHVLGDSLETHAIECWNFCVMPNHYHATLKPTRPNLSKAIQYVNSEYAKWWNRRHERVGHVFQGRFKNQIVDHTQYLLTLSRYVERNPVRAGLVERPEEWPWSSYRAMVGVVSCPSFLVMLPTLCMFGEEEDTRRAGFVRFVNTAPDDDAMVDRIRSNERILGSTAFKRWVGNASRSNESAEPTLLSGSESGARSRCDG